MNICSNKACKIRYKTHSFIWRDLPWCCVWCAKNDGKRPEGLNRLLDKDRIRK